MAVTNFSRSNNEGNQCNSTLLYFEGFIANKNVTVLVDGGSMGNFISENVVRELNLRTSERRQLAIKKHRGLNCTSVLIQIGYLLELEYIHMVTRVLYDSILSCFCQFDPRN